MPIGAGLSSSLFEWGPLSLLGLWLLAAVLPLNRLLARLLDLPGGCGRGAASPRWPAFRFAISEAWDGLSRGVSWWPLVMVWPPIWFEEVVTDMADVEVSG
jgi:hypothetical protein